MWTNAYTHNTYTHILMYIYLFPSFTQKEGLRRQGHLSNSKYY